MYIIPNLTQGDRVTWTEKLPDYNPATDTLSCFIRGEVQLDLTATADNGVWLFVISESESQRLPPGKNRAQLVIYPGGTGRKTLAESDFTVCQSFENLSEPIDTRDPDEIELEEITKAIAKLVSGAVAEYYIGTRRVRYVDLDSLTRRQTYLRNRLAKKKNPSFIGGRNVGIRFCN